jgi:cephalosporin hydroxylase
MFRDRLRFLLDVTGLRPFPREAAVRNPACSEPEVDSWVVSRLVLSRLVPVVGSHPFPLHELMLMASAVALVRPEMIFEWGTHVGKSARVFFEAARQFDVDVQIHSVDLPDDVEHGEHPGSRRGALVRGLPGVHLHQGDGLDVSLEIWRRDPRSRALFFVDGDHAYSSVQRELRGIIETVPQAAILLHDTFFQSPASAYNVGPAQAIVEALEAHPGRYRRMDSGLGLPGMTLLLPR